MAEYIARQAVEKFIEDGLNNPDENKRFGHDAIEIMAEVHYMPAADVAPVVHGWWESVDSSYWRWTPSGAVFVAHITYRCERCGRGTVVKTDYCPNCGAKMGKEVD